LKAQTIWAVEVEGDSQEGTMNKVRKRLACQARKKLACHFCLFGRLPQTFEENRRGQAS